MAGITATDPAFGLRLGRYLVFDEVACGGMASIYLARSVGDGGFQTTVAVKRLHPQFARDATFVSMFLTEARLASRIRHPNVVTTHDVVTEGPESFLVMDFVHGISVSQLMRHLHATSGGTPVLPVAVAASILSDLLNGLHAAHEARSETGEPLRIVHRDVSPQNVLVGFDGTSRVIDFGIAHARNRFYETSGDGGLRGKLTYMAPEQLRGEAVDRRADVFACGILAWELFTGQRLFDHPEPGVVISRIAEAPIRPPSHLRSELPVAVDEVVLRALSRNIGERFATAEEMNVALERAIPPASQRDVRDWLGAAVGDVIAERSAVLARVEASALSASVFEEEQVHISVELPVAGGGPASGPGGGPPVHTGSARAARSSTDAVQGRGDDVVPGARARRGLLFSLMGMTCAALAIGVIVGGRSCRTVAVASPVPATSAGGPQASSDLPTTPPGLPAPTTQVATTAATSISDSMDASAHETNAPLASASRRAVVAGGGVRLPSRGVKHRAPETADCDPPWTVAADGVRRFKPECAAR